MSNTPATAVRWRCLDVLAWSVVITSVIIYAPRVGRTYLGDLSLLYMVPAAAAFVAAWRFGRPRRADDDWQCWRFRASWMTLLGMAPFASWWQRCPEPAYLAAGMLLCLAALGWALLETVALIATLASRRGAAVLVQDALLSRVALVYLLLIPITALGVTFVLATFMGMASVPSDWLRFWRLIPPFGRALLTYCPLVAVLNLARLLFRASGRLAPAPATVSEHSSGESRDG